MSRKLLDFAEKYVSGKITADEFADPYQLLWKKERDLALLAQDPPDLNEKLSTLFCLADQYNPDADRHYSEYDAVELKRRVKIVLEGGDPYL